MDILATTACAEQVWNEERLERPVTAPAWRLWRYGAPAVVLGCSQRRLLATVNDASGLPVLVRGSGGGAVLVGPWMLGLSVALPPDHRLVRQGPVPSYRWLGECLAGVLRDGGVVDALALSPAALAAQPARADDAAVAWACFGGLSPWEVLVGGRKIAGLAQVRRRHGVLLVGGLLLDAPDWPLLCRVLGRAAGEACALTQRTTSWSAATGRPAPAAALAAAIERGLAAALREPEALEERPLARHARACATA